MAAVYLNQLAFGKDALDLAAEALVHAIIVVGIEEAASEHPFAQVVDLIFGEADVAVSRHIYEWIFEKARLSGAHNALIYRNIRAGFLIDEFGEIGQNFRIVIPISAAVVVQPCKAGVDGRGNKRCAEYQEGCNKGKRLELNENRTLLVIYFEIDAKYAVIDNCVETICVIIVGGEADDLIRKADGRKVFTAGRIEDGDVAERGHNAD